MRIIARRTLRDFWMSYPDAEQPLRAWFHEAKTSKWNSFQDVKAKYPTADLRPRNRVIFNVRGNRYRLIVKIHYNVGIIFIRFVGTHKEYDRIDPDSV
jgi:mRNA interferase HigB